MLPPILQLKKREDRRIRQGHPWVYSNEINTDKTPLKQFKPGDEALIMAGEQVLGRAYVNPHSLIAARLYTKDPNVSFDVELIEKRLGAALNLRERLFKEPCYRLVYSEADELPGLIIDRFYADFVLQFNTAGIDNKRAEVLNALQRIFPDLRSVLLKNDSPIRVQEGLTTQIEVAFGTPPELGELIENGVKFAFPLLGGQKTGWFYDHRLNRARLADYVKDKKVLDVFSYVGGWGIQAACFGATAVECIDASALACEYVEKNAVLNAVAEKVRVTQADAFDALKALQADLRYDVIILDPPAFVKKAKDKSAGLNAYIRLNELALKLLPAEGILFSCSCSMQVSEEEWLEVIKRASQRAGVTVQILERGHQGPDHPLHMAIAESNYLKAMIIRKLS